MALHIRAPWMRGLMLLLPLCVSAGHLPGQEAGVVTVPTIESSPVRDGKQEIALPGVVDDIDVGGGGRYLALHFKALQKIGIFDVNQLKIVGYVPAADADTKFAAGATKLMVVTGDSGVISRWDLATQEKELAQAIDLGGAVGHALLGSASAGPALVSGVGRSYDGAGMLVDLETLQTTPMQAKGGRGFGAAANVRISADGSVISSWASGVSPSGLQTYVQVGNSWTSHYEHNSAGYLVPSPDGRRIYTGGGIYTHQLRLLERGRGFSIPALHGPYYLTVMEKDRADRSPERVFLKIEGDDRPLAEIGDLEQVFSEQDRSSRHRHTLDKRLFLIPAANLLVQLTMSNDKLIALHFDVDAALRDSEIDYLFVSSRPPLAVRAGEPLKYQLDVKSKAGGVTYSLDSGPEGMQLSPGGLLTWTTSEDSPASSHVIVTVSDQSGQQIFHTFQLAVKGGNEKVPIAAATDPGAESTSKPITTTPADVQEQATQVRLPGTVDDVVVGGNGRFLFFHLRDLRKIAVLDVSEAKIAGYLPASDDDTKVVAGATKALIFSGTQGIVTRYRLDTLERELAVAIPFPDPIQFVAMGAGSEGPVLLRTSKGTGALDSCAFRFMDIHTMKPLEVDWPYGQQPHSVYRDHNIIHASTNGEVFVVQGAGVWRLHDSAVEILGGHSSHGGLPAADGKHFLANGRLLNADLQPLGDPSTTFGIAIPSVTGQYFLSFSNTSPHLNRPTSGEQNAKLYMFGEARPLVTLQDLAVSFTGTPGYGQGLAWDKRIIFVPEAEVIVTVPPSNDHAVLRRFRIDEALEASGVDYLVVASQAPRQANLGESYEYAMDVKSKRGGVQYTLDAAPPGMTVSDEGKIAWNVPADVETAEHSVIVSVLDDSGQSVFHTFLVTIPEIKQRLAAAQREREQQERLAQAEAQRQAIEQREQERLELFARQRAAPAAEQPAKSETFRPAMRIWTDSSGEHQVTGQFVELVDKKTVVLLLENGQRRTVPLSRLSNEDIYEAVKNELLRQGILGHGTRSPFEEP